MLSQAVPFGVGDVGMTLMTKGLGMMEHLQVPLQKKLPYTVRVEVNLTKSHSTTDLF